MPSISPCQYQINNCYQLNNQTKTPVVKDNSRGELSKLLFGKSLPSSKDISFGWSKGPDEIESRILDILTDKNNENILIASHIEPDGDAYGSAIAVSGLLKSLGKQVFPVINDIPANRFSMMPSPVKYQTATDFIQSPDQTERILYDKGLSRLDVAVITDCAIPERASDEVLKLAKKANKIIIIDHHPDKNDSFTNKSKWEMALRSQGIKQEDIIYWREPRASVSEMIAELDKEVVTEYQSGKLPAYKPGKRKVDLKYRIAAATGIITDTGARQPGNVNNPQFDIVSKKMVKQPDGREISSTEAAYNWLIDNSGVSRSEINFNKYTHLPISDELKRTLNDVVTKKASIDGVIVNPPELETGLGYFYIKDWQGIKELAKQETAKGYKVNKEDIYTILKSLVKHKLIDSRFKCVYIMATRKKENNSFSLSVRSNNNLSLKIVKELEAKGLGTGGGHTYACGFISNPDIDFEKDALPIIQSVIDKNKPDSCGYKNQKATSFTGNRLKINV